MKTEPAQTLGVAGASALTMELLGLPLQPIVWGLIGSFVGAQWAPAMTGRRALFLYPAAALVSALLGHLAAHQWFSDSRVIANGGAALLAVVFHPLMASVVALVPNLVQKVVARVTGEKGA